MRLYRVGKVLLCTLSVLLCACSSKRNVTLPVIAPAEPLQTEVVQQSVITEPQPEPEPVVAELEATARPLVNTVERLDAQTDLGRLQLSLDTLCSNPIMETTQLGLYIYDLTEDRPVYAVNAGQRMRPASNQKVITSVAALHYLGDRYRFRTDLHIKGTVSQGVLNGDVYVVGGMDPLLSPADLQEMALALKEAGISSITGQTYADLTMKDDLQYGWGWCWDDDYGPLSALMVDGKDIFAQAWNEALTANGIDIREKEVAPQQLPSGTKRIHSSYHTISEVMTPMMKESDNIFAECMFYQIAASCGIKKAGHKLAAKRIDEMVEKQLGLRQKRHQIADGSGLSLYNYTTAETLVRMLNYAYLNESIRQTFFPTLPIAGVDGTLAKRMTDTPAQNNVRAKTGTVYGISSLSGYCITGFGHLLTFCIINQGVPSSSIGKDFQDKVCIRLCQKQ